MDSKAKDSALKAVGLLALVGTVYVGVLALSALKEYRYIGGGYPSGNVISVTGEGEVFAVPDIAEITFSVTEEAKTLTVAQEAAATKMNAAIAYVKSQGVDEKDIKTTNYSANPRYEYRDTGVRTMSAGGGSVGYAEPAMMPVWDGGGDTRVLVGYEVNQSVSVKVRDTDKAGAILRGITAKGITNVYGPNFTIDDEDALQREARTKAIDDAKAKAEQLADDLGVRLVRIVSFNDNSGGYYPMYAKAEMMTLDSGSSAPTVPDLPLGENRVASSVTVTYEIR